MSQQVLAGPQKDSPEYAVQSCIAYNKKTGTKASTTGTVYGIYDTAGGSDEHVAACLTGQEKDKFGVEIGTSKYVDLYTNSSDSGSNYDASKIGDSMKETKGWNSDSCIIIYGNYSVAVRGR